jgi:hypothetical protein
MTDRDEASKGFLERWSRKKLDAEREVPATAAEPGAKEARPADDVRPPERHSKAGANTPAEAAAPAFDLASLPSLDSITAATDIRAFLAPGVPTELARAALRRAWAADPGIRDFKGLAENDWDFTDPTAMPGFGALPPGTDITKMLTKIFGEEPTEPGPDEPAVSEALDIAGKSEPPEAAAEVASPTEEHAESSSPQISTREQQHAQGDFVQRDNNTALHNSISDDETEERKTRRPHGGALPQ